MPSAGFCKCLHTCHTEFGGVNFIFRRCVHSVHEALYILKECSRNTAFTHHLLIAHKACGEECPAYDGGPHSRDLVPGEWSEYGGDLLARTKDCQVVAFIHKKMR